jgi:hypothetical protein
MAAVARIELFRFGPRSGHARGMRWLRPTQQSAPSAENYRFDTRYVEVM